MANFTLPVSVIEKINTVFSSEDVIVISRDEVLLYEGVKGLAAGRPVIDLENASQHHYSFSKSVPIWVTDELPGSSAWRRDFEKLNARQDLCTLILVFTGPPHRYDQERLVVEGLAFGSGWRKHPAYYLFLDYESLQAEEGLMVVPLERIPDLACKAFPMEALREERDLHMDMLREYGERSDGHVIRYHLAAEQVRAGDRVLDGACGLGYGSYVLAYLTRCAEVIGVDGSEYAIQYAIKNFSPSDARLSFQQGWLPDHLSGFSDESFDVIVSFETLEHVQNPEGLLAEFSRLLRPNGRVIVSVPNNWADETGKDPNPHHLHVYTLEKLREQISRFFVRDKLYQQIASGCKRSAAGNIWQPFPRTLRQIPVDTAVPPDSEWWVMVGYKPDIDKSLSYQRSWLGEVESPWAASARGECLANGVVLAMHCVPATVDPLVERFWVVLSQALAARGYTLVLLSTAKVLDSSLYVIEIPYELTTFSRHYSRLPSAGIHPSEQVLLDAVNWYGCGREVALSNLQLVTELISDLLLTLRPCAVLGWQAINPITRLLCGVATEWSIPYWNAERGWVRNTIQVDLEGPHLLGESRLSLAGTRRRKSYRPTASILSALTARARGAKSLDRYSAPSPKSACEIREKLSIPADAKIAVFFTHGEPSMNAMGSSVVRELHDLSPELLQERFEAVSAALIDRGYWVLVQEHPFNEFAGRKLRAVSMPQVIEVKENVSSLLTLADLCLFTLATLQFDAVFLEKPIGLLSRSGIYRDGVPPFIGDYREVNDFVDALLDGSRWPNRFAQLQAEVAFMFENNLIDIEEDAVGDSVVDFAGLLSDLVRPVDENFPMRVDSFLQKWGSQAASD